MRSCTVSAPVQSCSVPLTGATKKYAAVQLLNKHKLYFVVEVKSRAKELYEQTCAHLGNQGMLDTELFGLAVLTDGEYLFVDPDNKLSKYAPKHWRSSHGHGLDGNGRPSLVLYFRVQFYVDSPLLLRDETSRHHYYLQLRHNVQAWGLVHACASEEVLYVLAGYALQADLGDWVQDQHTGTYFCPAEYFPTQMVQGDHSIAQMVSSLHRENHGLSKAQAEMLYIREASSAEVSPLTHNSHLYRLKHKKQEQGPGSVWLAICAQGIQIYEENSTKALTAMFLWNNIGKLCFDRKKFEIRATNWPESGEKYTYYTNSDEKSKHLLFLCKVTHQFSMKIQTRLSEVRRREEEERKRFRDCYMYTRSGHYKTTHPDQRISVISNTSSNTTSGIVSDRVQSLDESEDDLEIEIMINSPPAPSVESLALAHLRDAPSPQLKGEDEADGLGQTDNTQKTSPSGSAGTGVGGAATPATTDGSQCSSSCSTVVVAGVGLALANNTCPTNREPCDQTEIRRRASTSSSLELGYSHTAQNSTVSDTTSACLELDYSVQSAHTSSGIYTLRSSCGTTEDTNACSSETSGVYAGCSSVDSCHHTGSYSIAGASVDSNPEIRPRSGSDAVSVVSASGSFRGDGSDPSEAGPRSLLTAEELSDLIVGRDSTPASDGYPSRENSGTLDSDSDYVTLPPPPMPPPRTDSDANYVMLEPKQEITSSPARLPLPPAEEAAARFITTKPHINILTAHTSMVAPTAAPSYAAPTLTYQPSNNQVTQPLITTESHQVFPAIAVKPTRSISKPVSTPQNISISQPPIEPRINMTPTSPNFKSLSIPQSVAETRGILASIAAANLANPQRCVPVSQVPLQPFINYPIIDPGAKMKPSPFPVISKNNYLDVHASKTKATGCSLLHSPMVLPPQFRQFSPPPPPMLHTRQPPPPPPPPPPPTNPTNMATVYTSQVTRSQIEQFRQQMFSDVDYVIYPMQDPAISKQEYIDAKQGSLIAHSAHFPPPPYSVYHPNTKGHYMYRSTPNVAASAGFLPFSFSNPPLAATPIKYSSNQNLSSDLNINALNRNSQMKFASNQNLSSDYNMAAFVKPVLSGGAIKYSSNQNLSTDFNGFTKVPIGAPVKYASNQNLSSDQTYYGNYLTSGHYSASTSPLYSAAASYSSSSTQSLRYDQFADFMPLHVPPPCNQHLTGFSRAKSDDNILNSYEKPVMERPKYRRLPPPPPPPPYDQQMTVSEKPPAPPPQETSNPTEGEGMLDIRTLREKSKNLDLPLISALCNDRSLLKQTNAFVMPRHPGSKPCERPVSWHESSTEGGRTQKGTLLSSILSGSKHPSYKLKYPVSGLSTTQISKPQRKVSATHTHPHQVTKTRSNSSGGKTKDTVVPSN